MIFSDSNDISRCTEIVRKELLKNNVNVSDEILNKITLAVMNISYSKGGDYSDKIIQSFAKTYVEEGKFPEEIER
ncbi:hypothetical protein [Anaerocolumna xylanovorans]|uniref:Uncharacterized protein n=1 Tax=Anaerocolumna xylanovorans DSM 12503 TaxID=1121345 RepID=A0A1M7XXX5_9FIRM|nr:hypothetical protein [Anaerocolumna xylanovorans]SHO43810.1 hypothetical protein SAMN02745217_00363 [Anaerocolumna xylanovorans DSM 12503]